VSVALSLSWIPRVFLADRTSKSQKPSGVREIYYKTNRLDKAGKTQTLESNRDDSGRQRALAVGLTSTNRNISNIYTPGEAKGKKSKKPQDATSQEKERIIRFTWGGPESAAEAPIVLPSPS